MKVKREDSKHIIISFADKFGMTDYSFTSQRAAELRDKLIAVLPIKESRPTVARVRAVQQRKGKTVRQRCSTCEYQDGCLDYRGDKGSCTKYRTASPVA